MNIDWSNAQLSLRPANDEERRIALEFQKLWGSTCTAGEELGWDVSPGAIVQLYFQFNDRSVASEIFVSPSKRDRFLFRVTPNKRSICTAICEALRPVVSELPGAEVAACTTTRSKGVKVDVVEVRSTWADVIGDDNPSSKTVASRLHDFVVPLLKAIPGK